ncbi:hypothetical protein LCGC14_2286700 [marine sediment metagenome]|uniref:Transposase Tn5-like N-terminal domain-containing protein n=1 Tax=marine sediment metagenome TaxID=412755 RepID=A0A0F9CSZ5_9ZZZZ
MLAPWVIDEVKDVNLEDKRLNSRLAVILDQLGGHPTASIPAACGGYAEMMAAYRFFDNEKTGFENILQAHIKSTWKRISQQPVVILAQDTTEVDFTRPEQQVVGAGPLDGDSRRGALVHPMMGFTPDGTPLGTVYAEAWVRDDESPTPKSQRENKRKHTPIEEKESVRWVDALRHARDLAEDVPQTQLISVADSEADIYELFEESQGGPENLNWIVRACQNRALQKDEKHANTTANHLRERVLKEDVLFTHTITVRGRKAKVGCETRGRRQPRKSRRAKMEVRAARVTLRAPWRHDRKLADISINVVLVSEVDPPAGDTPVEWILLTSLPIDKVKQVLTIIQYYCVRWMIEVFFRVLKSGCRVEERRFEHIDRALSCLAIYLIVTWRTLYVCRLGREFPEISCEAVFEPAEWKSVYYVVHKKPPPTTPPTLQEMVRMVAQLGGYINRKRTDEPGPQTVWLGLQRTHDIANCWITFGPEGKHEKILV